MFKVGELYRLKYTFVGEQIERWDYLVEVKKVNKKSVYLYFTNLDGSSSGCSVERHELKTFKPGGGTVVQKLSKLELALK